MEKIELIKNPGLDTDGYPLTPPDPVGFMARRIEPASLDDVLDEGGQWTRDALKVFTTPGVAIEDGDTVIIRGLEYTVRATAWDYSQGRYRRPALSRHAPSVVFFAERQAGFG